VGAIHVPVTLRVLNGGGTFAADFLVDTGATDCLAPAAELRKIHMQPVGKMTYELADGTAHEYPFGLARVESVDVAGNPSIKLDLQEQLPSELVSQFDLIIDAGTLFWCFDLASVLKNCLMMLKDRGAMIHVCALTGHFGRGYYNIHPKMFRDFYAQNGLEMLATEIRVHKQPSLVAKAQKKLWGWSGRSTGGYVPIGGHALFLKNADFVSMEFTSEATSEAPMLPNDALFLCAAKRERRSAFTRPIP